MMHRRTIVGRVWYSRIRLIALNVILVLLLLTIRYYRPPSNNDDISNFDTDVDYALDTLQYMRDMQSGHAKIAPVVEREQPIVVIRKEQCATRPQLNNHTEWLQVDRSLYLYSAYYDMRVNSLFPSVASVQVLAMSTRTLNTVINCRLYFDDTSTMVVRAHTREIWQRGWDPRDRFYIPQLVTCPVPSSHRPHSVTIGRKIGCDNDGVIAVVQPVDPPTPQNDRPRVVVCVKGMDFVEGDIANRLVEWIELQLMLGADRIVVYTYYVHPAIARLLDYYEKTGKLLQIRLRLPGNSPNQPFTRSKYIWRNRQQKRRHELIPYNDCLYRHIYTHTHVLIVDIDEVVVPLQHSSWIDMLEQIAVDFPDRRDQFTSISIINAFKFPSLGAPDIGVPAHMHMLRHRRRSKALSNRGDYGKSFTVTRNVATVFNHFSLHRLRSNLSATIYVRPNVALKLHYKQSCPIESRDECFDLKTSTVDDTSLDRFAANLTARVSATIARLLT